MKIIIAGNKGKLGSKVSELLQDTHDVSGFDMPEVDITKFDTLRETIQSAKPDVIINCAAWTDVDDCALNPEKAIAINGYGAKNLSIAAYEAGAAILQVSSNEVFNGKKRQAYTEYDDTEAVNPYGYSKLVGERAVQATNPRHYIVRTSWLFAHGGRNFVQAILGAAEAGKDLKVVVDEVAHPTYNDDVAAAIAQLVETDCYGAYHFVNQGAVSRWTFARHVLDKTGFADMPMDKISINEWKRPSKPPVYTELANIAGEQIGITLRDWRTAVDAFLEKEGLI